MRIHQGKEEDTKTKSNLIYGIKNTVTYNQNHWKYPRACMHLYLSFHVFSWDRIYTVFGCDDENGIPNHKRHWLNSNIQNHLYVKLTEKILSVQRWAASLTNFNSFSKSAITLGSKSLSLSNSVCNTVFSLFNSSNRANLRTRSPSSPSSSLPRRASASFSCASTNRPLIPSISVSVFSCSSWSRRSFFPGKDQK